MGNGMLEANHRVTTGRVRLTAALVASLGLALGTGGLGACTHAGGKLHTDTEIIPYTAPDVDELTGITPAEEPEPAEAPDADIEEVGDADASAGTPPVATPAAPATPSRAPKPAPGPAVKPVKAAATSTKGT